ncbi:DUF2207 domain-containing protein [Lunatimonas salinarum]|uniref:DUF2207 domain-containing protein n=1 Tax=Lunatimonas salinarum TaxID=1774590 RepID=UPI001AE07D46|nr:DUF2207 domain-containing protein [Lunatimonas salinarum]
MKQLLLISLLLLLSYPLLSQEREEILDYQSDIAIKVDGTLQVTETITVKSLQQEIQRGIFRSFPTIYRDKYGNRVKVGFEVTNVLKDGQPEPYEVLTEGDFQIIRIGNPDVFLNNGNYTYTISYTTNRQIGYFEEFDELYWNVIGDSWAFPILQAEARITLPTEASILQYAGYSGPVGSSSCNCNIEKAADNVLSISLSEPLNPREALTVAVAWPKGIVEEPDSLERNLAFLGDNAGILIALIGLLIVVGYYFFAWKKVGVDPKRGGIYPLFEAPRGLDAPAIRYIHKMGFDQTSFTVAMVQLATKGILKIVEEKRKFYLHLQKTEEEAELEPFEKAVIRALFPAGTTVVHLTQKEHKKIGGALKAVQEHLKTNYKGKYFKLNQTWLIPGFLLSLATVFLTFVAVFPMRFEEEKVFLIMGTLVTVFLSGVVSNLIINVYNAFFGESVTIGKIIGNVFSILFVLVLPGVLIYQFGARFEYGILILFLALSLVNYIFFYLMKAPTPEGRKVLDEIEGFRMYLNAAEKPAIQQLNPPGLTPEVFEKYLPYAMALGVGDAWGKSFENSLKTYEQTSKTRSSYRPGWYSGGAFTAGAVTGLSKGLGKSFGSALNNSSAPPGSKSGSGGGGRSGGGGGGGGGGGW